MGGGGDVISRPMALMEFDEAGVLFRTGNDGGVYIGKGSEFARRWAKGDSR